jgi:hypothetical protein
MMFSVQGNRSPEALNQDDLENSGKQYHVTFVYKPNKVERAILYYDLYLLSWKYLVISTHCLLT